jgi:hypothetical protein
MCSCFGEQDFAQLCSGILHGIVALHRILQNDTGSSKKIIIAWELSKLCRDSAG